MKLTDIFQTSRPFIGMIHFPPLIGYPDSPGFPYICQKTLQETKILTQAGVDAIMVENNYDIPHYETIAPYLTAQLAILTNLVCQNTHLPVGISTLWNDYQTSLGVCTVTRANFIRVPAFVDTVDTTYGRMVARSKEAVALRHTLNLDHVAILADIQVKHSQMVDKTKPLSQSALEAIAAHADALIITGQWTGDQPKTEDLSQVRKVVNDFPILIGSGTTADNLSTLLNYADGVIVGTALKANTKIKHQVNIKPYDVMVSLPHTKKIISTFRKCLKKQ